MSSKLTNRQVLEMVGEALEIDMVGALQRHGMLTAIYASVDVFLACNVDVNPKINGYGCVLFALTNLPKWDMAFGLRNCHIIENTYEAIALDSGEASSEAFRRWWRGGREQVRDMACVERLRDV